MLLHEVTNAFISFTVFPRRKHVQNVKCCMFYLPATNESGRTEVSTVEKSEADKIVDDMDFGELCNEFECNSSPSIESSARQLVRDILELREGNRALGTYAVSVKYKVLAYSTQVYLIFRTSNHQNHLETGTWYYHRLVDLLCKFL